MRGFKRNSKKQFSQRSLSSPKMSPTNVSIFKSNPWFYHSAISFPHIGSACRWAPRSNTTANFDISILGQFFSAIIRGSSPSQWCGSRLRRERRRRLIISSRDKSIRRKLTENLTKYYPEWWSINKFVLGKDQLPTSFPGQINNTIRPDYNSPRIAYLDSVQGGYMKTFVYNRGIRLFAMNPFDDANFASRQFPR